MLISKEKRQDAVDYSMKSIRYICENIGPRESGMPKEREAQEWLQKEIKDNGWADSVETDEFVISRHALVGFTKIVGVMLILGALFQLLWFAPSNAAHIAAQAIGFSMAFLSLLITVLEFLFYLEPLDKLLPRSVSTNTYAKYAPSGEVKRRIVFNGHVDSAYEWTLMKIHQNVMVAVLVIDILFLVASIAIFLYGLICGMKLWIMIFALISIIPFIGVFFVCNFKVLSPGANDNLSGTFAALSVLKCFKESGIRFENTEICALLTGSEEAGLRGAKAWGIKHKAEIDAVPTYVISFDTLTDYDWMTIYEKDMTSLVKNSKKVCDLIDKACADEEIQDRLPKSKIDSKVTGKKTLVHGGVPFGASDAAALSKLHIDAACIAAQDPRGTDYYHNTRDNPDRLVPESFALGLDIALACAEVFDKEGK
ncbi:MAG: M28 family peptidase [Clostridia bacterium]|nr:M28 family peptidase [Clostridia bacterium]